MKLLVIYILSKWEICQGYCVFSLGSASRSYQGYFASFSIISSNTKLIEKNKRRPLCLSVILKCAWNSKKYCTLFMVYGYLPKSLDYFFWHINGVMSNEYFTKFCESFLFQNVYFRGILYTNFTFLKNPSNEGANVSQVQP